MRQHLSGSAWFTNLFIVELWIHSNLECDTSTDLLRKSNQHRDTRDIPVCFMLSVSILFLLKWLSYCIIFHLHQYPRCSLLCILFTCKFPTWLASSLCPFHYFHSSTILNFSQHQYVHCLAKYFLYHIEFQPLYRISSIFLCTSSIFLSRTI